MKSARILICLLALAWWSAAAPAPSTRTQRPGKSLIGGRIHTDLTAWAAANGFTARWNSRAGELRLTNRWAKLLFKADTKRAMADFKEALRLDPDHDWAKTELAKLEKP